VDAALAKFEETFDIDRGDLSRLLRQVEVEAAVRSHGTVSCADIMSRDVIAVGENATAEDARALLLKHNIRTLPVKDGSGRLIGTVGLRELMQAEQVAGHIVTAATAPPDAPAVSLLPVLTDGRTHAVVIVDPTGHVVGLISQTDLLSATAHMLPERTARIAA
jgi:CBS domain-containing membrane protein